MSSMAEQLSREEWVGDPEFMRMSPKLDKCSKMTTTD